MAYAALGRLARAVSEAGGLGMIGVGPRDTPEMIEREGALVQGVRFGFGLMVWVLETKPELLDAAIAQKPYMLSISFGSVKPYVERLHRAGILLATQVSDRAAAVDADEAGADLIVAQGTEAGGHTGAVGTLTLLQIVLDAVRAPVAAAGGIATPRGLAAVLAAGASAAWIGTPFLLCPEAQVTDAARERILAAKETDTIHTRVFDRVNRLAWPPQFPGRALRNRFAEQWHGREDELMNNPEEIARFREGAANKDYDVTSIYAGQAVGLLDRVQPAGEYLEWLCSGADRLLQKRC